jgi:uncharacterized protein YggE
MKKYLFVLLVISNALYNKAQSQQILSPYPKTINVSGSADMEIIPDEIYVQVDLKEYKKKGENKTELEKIKTDFLAQCKKTGITDSAISIASYEGANLSYWAWRKRKKDPDLYASIAYQIKFRDSKKMDELVAVLDDEATSNFSIVKVSHSKMTEFRKQLKIMAIKAAKDKSVYLAEAISEKIGEAITITEPAEDQFSMSENTRLISQYSNSLGLSNSKYQVKEDEAGISDVDFKKIKLRYEVNVVFALK